MAGKKKGNKTNKVTPTPKQKGKAPVANPENQTTLGDLIKDADQAVIITSVKGQLEVTGIKNINYAYEAKGLLVGAMDTYNSRPVINGLNNNTRAILSHLVNINNKITKLVGPEEEKVEK